MTDSQRRGLHVLAVDDEEPAVQQMRWLLEADPLVADVETATSVAEATDVLRRRSIDVVLLDIHMPGTNGMELARELHRQDSAETPHVVFVTADARPAAHAFELDSLDYLLKPVRPARLHDALRKTLNRAADAGARSGAHRSAPGVTTITHPDWFNPLGAGPGGLRPDSHRRRFIPHPDLAGRD